jgi:CRP-like cAMP-binding protein
MTAFRIRTNERLALLGRLNLFSSCNKAELSRIESLSTMIKVQQGTVLTREGRTGLEFFVIAEGTATASRHGQWLADFSAGSFFGEVALLDRHQRTATVVADTDMSLLVLSRIEFNSLQDSAPMVWSKMLAEMAVRLRRIDALLDEESSASARPMVAVGASRS